ncbi:unnamed protein product [Zymoseptoria tritici ST99CH_3D7]|uniref:Extracellular membrane protein CFEM domain-containing protein n=1 Tax=Zymoseptoria tritici (strain ST99CH_3D7) TaxID=1276538 RepID=A0A1X7S899_ZYMT9|nr:unnamed protein product [Zymoseptoria tritici ST99CH_3D7]
MQLHNSFFAVAMAVFALFPIQALAGSCLQSACRTANGENCECPTNRGTMHGMCKDSETCTYEDIGPN